MKLEDVILRGDRASQPAAATVPVGTLYYVTDENVTERNNGVTWDDYSDTGGGGGGATLPIDLTTDVTGDLPLANLAPSAAASRVLGRGDSGPGDYEPLTLGPGLLITGTTLDTAAAAAVTPSFARTFLLMGT